MAPTPSPPEVLLRAASRARVLRDRVTVVKLGGSALEHPEAAAGTLAALAVIQSFGVRLVVVHGGGKPIDRAMAAADLDPVKIAGRRYTDDATLAVVVRVLSGITADIVAGVREAGGDAERFPREAGPFPLSGERLMLPGYDLQPVDLGRVGTVTGVDVAVLGRQPRADAGFEIPVLPSLAVAADGGWLNVNADTAAAAVAGALRAAAVLFLTDTAGVLRDPADPASRFARLTRRECDELIAAGVISGGMVPKVEACFEALDAGAGRAVILDGRDPHALLREFVGAGVPGTEVVP